MNRYKIKNQLFVFKVLNHLRMTFGSNFLNTTLKIYLKKLQFQNIAYQVLVVINNLTSANWALFIPGRVSNLKCLLYRLRVFTGIWKKSIWKSNQK